MTATSKDGRAAFHQFAETVANLTMDEFEKEMQP